jgi:putative endonuclease
MAWFVYMVTCADGTLYTGVTTDVERRVCEHNGTGGMRKGAKYTKARRPVVLAYQESVEGRSAAQRREATLRCLTHQQKLLLAQIKHS